MLRNRVYVDPVEQENVGRTLKSKSNAFKTPGKGLNGSAEQRSPSNLKGKQAANKLPLTSKGDRILLVDKTNKASREQAAPSTSSKGQDAALSPSQLKGKGKAKSSSVTNGKSLLAAPQINHPKRVPVAPVDPALKTPSPGLARRKQKLLSPSPGPAAFASVASPLHTAPNSKKWLDIPVELPASDTAVDPPFQPADFDLPDPSEMDMPYSAGEIPLQEEGDSGNAGHWPAHCFETVPWDSLQVGRYSPEPLVKTVKPRTSLARTSLASRSSLTGRSPVVKGRQSTVSHLPARNASVASPGSASRRDLSPHSANSLEAKQAHLKSKTEIENSLRVICAQSSVEDDFLFDLE